MKKTLSLIICLVILIGIIPTVGADYNGFTDVKKESWYYNDVMNAVRLGIINGKSDTEFAPDDNLTYAEAIKLAACMHQLYKDGSVYLVSTTNPWYDTYVQYCEKNGVISKQYNYSAFATRAGYMEIFANALPDEALPEINEVPDGSIPDVPKDAEYAPAIYKLYRAGILQGVDEAHNCTPLYTIRRCEVAAIITRMTNKNERITFSMGEEKPEEQPEEKEEPKLEIPEDAKPAPEIDENAKSEEKTETPDMYEPFEIAVQPEEVSGAKDGDVVKYTVKATGGKTPYTYSWLSRAYRNQYSPIEESQYVSGTKTNTLSMACNMANPITTEFCCEVTDALGQTVKSETVMPPEKLFTFAPENAIKNDLGTIFTGRVSSGKLKVGETIAISMPDKKICGYGAVKSIEMFKKSIDEVSENDYCGILIEEFEDVSDLSLKTIFGESMAEYIESLGTYGVKLPMKVIPCVYFSGKMGDVADVFVLVSRGVAPYTYEWFVQKNGGEYTKIESNSKYTPYGNGVKIVVDEDEFASNIRYRCDITDALGNTKSNTIAVNAPQIPYLYLQPKDTYANVGDEVIFSVRSRCHEATFKWYYRYDGSSWKEILPTDTWASGADYINLKIRVEKEDLKNHIEYRCEVKNGQYSIYSDTAKLLPYDVVITKDPEIVSGRNGENVQFKVVAEGANAPFTYQWVLDHPSFNTPIVLTQDTILVKGLTTDTITVAVDEKVVDSDLKFSCIVTDANGVKRQSKQAYVILTQDAKVDLRGSEEPEPGMIVIIK